MHFSRVDFAGPDRQRRIYAGRILAAGAGVSIDLIAISALLQVVALVLFPLTHGQVQFSGGPLYGLSCQKLASVPGGVSIPPEFNANSVTDCQQSLLGLPTARTLRVSRITKDGAVTKVAQIRQRLGADGKPTSGLPLDIFVLPLLIALRFAFNRTGGSLVGGSLGRRICRLRLSNASDGHPKRQGFLGRGRANADRGRIAGVSL
jgi:hypothetical protein